MGVPARSHSPSREHRAPTRTPRHRTINNDAHGLHNLREGDAERRRCLLRGPANVCGHDAVAQPQRVSNRPEVVRGEWLLHGPAPTHVHRGQANSTRVNRYWDRLTRILMHAVRGRVEPRCGDHVNVSDRGGARGRRRDRRVHQRAVQLHQHECVQRGVRELSGLQRPPLPVAPLLRLVEGQAQHLRVSTQTVAPLQAAARGSTGAHVVSDGRQVDGRVRRSVRVQGAVH